MTASGVGFAGGGDGVLRAFDLRTGKVLWTFQTGRQIAAGPTIFSAGGKEYIAITVGGTPTSSGGGLASQLQVFALGGSKAESPRPPGLAAAGPPSPSEPAARKQPHAVGRVDLPRLAAGARIAIPSGAITLTCWNPNSSNLRDVDGASDASRPAGGGARGRPSTATCCPGRRRRRDVLGCRRHDARATAPVRRRRTRAARRVGGRALTAAERASLRAASGGINVGYGIVGVRVTRRRRTARVRVTGRAVRADGVPAPPVVLLSYRLSGTITDAAGRPVQGGYVVSRTNDRDFWTFSEPSNASGRYVSFFPASDLSEADPVEFTSRWQSAARTTRPVSGIRPSSAGAARRST